MMVVVMLTTVVVVMMIMLVVVAGILMLMMRVIREFIIQQALALIFTHIFTWNPYCISIIISMRKER